MTRNESVLLAQYREYVVTRSLMEQRPRTMNPNEDDNSPGDEHTDEHTEQNEAAGEEEKEDDEARTERRRYMNMIHSRRKRQRRKIEVEVLKEQVSELSQQNNRLQVENDVLERAVAEAQRLADLFCEQSKLANSHNYRKRAATDKSTTAGTSYVPTTDLLQQQLHLQQNAMPAHNAGGWASAAPPILPPTIYPSYFQQPNFSANQQQALPHQQLNLAYLLDQIISQQQKKKKPPDHKK